MLLANLVESRKARSRKSNDRRPRAAHARLAARPRRSPARREWNRRGLAPVRFARLRSALSILERRADGHHVVAYDPTEREADGPARRGQRRSPRGRDEIRQTRGKRVLREGEEDLEEVVRTSRRRQMKPAGLNEDAVDKIQIEVGSVSALQAKHGVYRGAFWITLLSLLLWWIPVLGPAVAGYVGGRKAGTPLRGAVAALIPISVAFGAFAVLASTTAGVPAAVRSLVEAGYTGALGSLPFDFPILEYVLGNLAAIMRAGPDALFSVLAFALVGGAVTQMKVQERMVPPITARIPASRVSRQPSEIPVRGLDRRAQVEANALIERLNEITARAGGPSRGRGSAATAEWSPRPRLRFPRLFGGGPDLRYSELMAREEESSGGLDERSRQVVAGFLASTPPARGDRRFKALKTPAVELDLPRTIAFASGPRGAGAEGPGAAHNFRPSKLYHIYGTSVNPVARAKLEKRLRRTHTLHAMRRGARSFADMAEFGEDGTVGQRPPAAPEAAHPRSLEANALTAEMRYDALEHLENASFEARRKAPSHPKADEEDLGGILAHIGADGVAVAEAPEAFDPDFSAGPMFDRRGRQRARIAGEEPLPTPKPPAGPHPPVKKPAAAPALVREAIATVEAQTRPEASRHEAPSRVQIAKSADRAELSPSQKEKVDRWVKRALAETDGPARKAETAKRKPVPTEGAHASAEHEGASQRAREPRKGEWQETRAKPLAPSFEVTHGSTEVDAEADTSETDSKVSRKNRSAADILREIREQKRADKDAEASAEVARAAKRAKAEADEIERHAREVAQSPIEMVALAAGESPEHTGVEPAKRRHRSEDLEPVSTDAERLGSDLELTLAPIREERVEIVEVAEEPAPSEASPGEGIPMVGAPEHQVNLAEAVELASQAASAGPTAEPERDVKPGDVVLAGPSTDVPFGAGAEGELSAVDHDRIRKRMQEGWNRL